MQGAYYLLYDMMSELLYGTDVVLTGDQTLTLTILCTIGTLFVIAVPFVVVWRCIKLFT